MSKIFTKPFRPLDYQTTPHDYTGDYNLGIYAVETTKRYIPGTRKLTWDGRVFKYSYANGAVVPYHGCRASEAAALSYTVNPVAVAKGERYITATVASRTEDDLAGGYITLYHSTIDNTTQYGIVGNEPVHLTHFKLDDRARVACKDISDWMYFEDGTLHGGYTIEVLSRMAAEHARRNNRSDES